MNLFGISLILLLTSCSFDNKIYVINNIICEDKDNGVYIKCRDILTQEKIAGVENAVNVIVKYRE